MPNLIIIIESDVVEGVHSQTFCQYGIFYSAIHQTPLKS